MPLDPTIEQMADIKTAVSEAVTNAIIHGYENNEGTVVLELESVDRLVTVRVSDSGVGIEDIERARMPLLHRNPSVTGAAWALRSWKALWTPYI